jgi:hypothetical protein
MARNVAFIRHGREVTKSGWCEVTGKFYQVTVPESEYLDWRDGTLIQRAMPSLSNEEREFMMSSTTPQEWKLMIWEMLYADQVGTGYAMSHWPKESVEQNKGTEIDPTKRNQHGTARHTKPD